MGEKRGKTKRAKLGTIDDIPNSSNYGKSNFCNYSTLMDLAPSPDLLQRKKRSMLSPPSKDASSKQVRVSPIFTNFDGSRKKVLWKDSGIRTNDDVLLLESENGLIKAGEENFGKGAAKIDDPYIYPLDSISARRLDANIMHRADSVLLYDQRAEDRLKHKNQSKTPEVFLHQKNGKSTEFDLSHPPDLSIVDSGLLPAANSEAFTLHSDYSKHWFGYGFSNKKKRCFRCGDLQHFFKDCTKLARLCFTCGRPGHIAKCCLSSMSTFKPSPFRKLVDSLASFGSIPPNLALPHLPEFKYSSQGVSFISKHGNLVWQSFSSILDLVNRKDTPQAINKSTMCWKPTGRVLSPFIFSDPHQNKGFFPADSSCNILDDAMMVIRREDFQNNIVERQLLGPTLVDNVSGDLDLRDESPFLHKVLKDRCKKKKMTKAKGALMKISGGVSKFSSKDISKYQKATCKPVIRRRSIPEEEESDTVLQVASQQVLSSVLHSSEVELDGVRQSFNHHEVTLALPHSNGPFKKLEDDLTPIEIVEQCLLAKKVQQRRRGRKERMGREKIIGKQKGIGGSRLSSIYFGKIFKIVEGGILKKSSKYSSKAFLCSFRRRSLARNKILVNKKCFIAYDWFQLKKRFSSLEKAILPFFSIK